MRAVANFRYVVIGRRDDGIEAPLEASDGLQDARDYADSTHVVNGREWTPVRIVDRRERPDLPATHPRQKGLRI